MTFFLKTLKLTLPNELTPSLSFDYANGVCVCGWYTIAHLYLSMPRAPFLLIIIIVVVLLLPLLSLAACVGAIFARARVVNSL